MTRYLLGLLTIFVLVAAVAIGPATPVDAHPLGNFTVNRYTRIEVAGDSLRLRYVVDMAEIPAFTEIKAIDKNSDGTVDANEAATYLGRKTPELLANLDLRLGNERVTPVLVTRELTTPEGQGGLDTLRIVLDLTAQSPAGWTDGADVTFADSNYSDRLGWKEIVVQNDAGVGLSGPNLPSVDVSKELTAYPEDQLKSPLAVTKVRFSYAPDGTVAATTGTNGASMTERPTSSTPFTRLIDERELTPAFIAVSFLIAMIWGAGHALGPGHGKTVVAAYLVGSRGTARHAVLLGLTVTAAHTSSVIALGLTTLYLSRFIAAEDLYLWLGVGSGALVVAIGAALFVSRLRSLLRARRRTNTNTTELSAFESARLATYADLALTNTSRGTAGEVQAILLDGDTLVRRLTPALAASHRVELVLSASSFDSHLGDRGQIVGPDGLFEVIEAQPVAGNGVTAHIGRLVEGSIAVGESTHTQVDGAAHRELEARHTNDFHSHDEHHGHSHVPTQPGIKGLLMLGISGGILPCPTALVVMLGAIAVDRVVYGLALILCFSLGLAGVLTVIGGALVYAGRVLQQTPRLGRLMEARSLTFLRLAAPMLSALVILAVGVVLTGRALSIV